MSDVKVTLGGIVLQDLEVPNFIAFGGHQMARMHKMVGGGRVADAMGRDDDPLEWTGRFFGASALERALAIDEMRKAGVPVQLTWDRLAYTVLITTFVVNYAYVSNLPYRIACEIITDDARPLAPGAGPSLDDAVAADMGSASTVANLIGNTSILAGLSTLTSAVGLVQSFSTASRGDIASVMGPLLALRSTVGGVQATTAGSVLGASGGSVAGMAAGGIGLAATLLSQVGATQQLPMLDDLDNVLARVQSNLTSAQTSGASVVQVGGDLYSLAVTAYGNEDAWPSIAEANGLTDPVLSGINSLVVPPTPVVTDGVLSP